MKIGAWIHDEDGAPLDPQIRAAAAAGLRSVRCYHLGYAEAAAGTLRETGMSLVAGMTVDASALLAEWQTQVQLDDLARYHALGIELDAICVGNELREGGDDPESKRFTARLSVALGNVITTYREWLHAHGLATPLTYAMEGTVHDRDGTFHDWVWPLIEACDLVSFNAYPMDNAAWFTLGAFEESRRLLEDARERRLRFDHFEFLLRRILKQLAQVDKPLILSETGFPSAVGYRMEGESVVPINDHGRYEEAMQEYIALIRRIDAEHDGRIRTIYFYEWRDNPSHAAVHATPPSPIHAAFGLCDSHGTPKLDIRRLTHPR